MHGLLSKTAAAALLLASAPGASAQLNKLAKAAGWTYFGTATDNSELSNSSYTAILDVEDNWGQLTPGNGQKWDYIEPTQNEFSYTDGDVVVDRAQKNGQIVRCHNLVWHSQLPSWVSSGSWTKSQLESIIKVHIKNEVGHYKGQCYAWDVVNEALSDSGGYRDDVFYNVLGTDYIPLAFKAAAAADPAAKLYYNDYNIEYSGTKQEEALKIVELIVAAGATIDGVGLQGHFIVGSSPSESDMVSVMNKYIAAGASEVAFTELDIRFESLPYSDTGLQTQADEYVAVVNACLKVDACVGITVWDFTDKYSWIPSTYSGEGGACLYDSDLNPKPAFSSVSSALAAAGGGAVATAASSSSSASVPVPTYPPAASSFSSSASYSAPAANTASFSNAFPAPTNVPTSSSSSVPAAGVPAPTPSPVSASAAATVTPKCNKKKRHHARQVKQ